MTVGVFLPDAPAPISDRRVFTAHGVAFTVADLARRAGVGGREASSGVQNAAAAEEIFRRARGLLTADKLEAWLDTWAIAAEDFRAWTEDVAAGTSTATAWCALMCSGAFDAITAQVASAAAAASELGAGPADASFDLADWTERLVAERTTTERLSDAIAAHRLDWTRLEVVIAVTQQPGVAEELRHQVVVDGVDLRAAAADAACPVHDLAAVLAELSAPGLRAALAGARAGELIGPVRSGDDWLLVSVTTRTGPTLDDPASKARAVASVRNDAITGAVARHVVA